MQENGRSGENHLDAWIKKDDSQEWKNLHRLCSEDWRSTEARRLNSLRTSVSERNPNKDGSGL